MKRILSFLLCVVILVTTMVSSTIVSNAASGNLMSDPVVMQIGKTYYKYWTSSSDHLNHYSQFTITEKGIVTIRASKPYDTNEYGRLLFALYDSSKNKIADSSTYYTVDDINDVYELKIGLNPGTYLFTIKPGFYVTSGLIETHYSVQFEPSGYCEIEPNETGAMATPISLGYYYTGFFGQDGGDCEEYDYFKFNVTAGHEYKFVFKDYHKIVPTTTIIYARMPGETSSKAISYYVEETIDANGNNYYTLKANQSGIAYLYFDNYGHEQYQYTFGITDVNANGWTNEGGQWVYYKNGTKLINQWMKDSTGWCYLGADGVMVTNNWVKDSVGECYIGPNGYILSNCWLRVGDDWVYLNSNGRKTVNQWKKDRKGWCYLGSDGIMVTNDWVKDSIGECYIGPEGYIISNAWIKEGKEGSNWTYVDANGRRAYRNRWMYKNPNWLYLGSDGYAVTSKWVKDSIGWCYLDENGIMVTNDWVEDSVGECYIGPKGYILSNTWFKYNGGWIYLNVNGRMVTNKWVKDSKGWCYLGDDGYAVTNCWRKDSVGWCYLDSEGSMTKNAWVNDGSNQCYIDNRGYRVTGEYTINGITYSFDSNGYLIAE